MDIITKELIAIGASVAANCHPCLKYHLKIGRENGAEDRQIAEAIEVGKMVRKGAGSEMDVLASSLVEPCATEECGCSENKECG